jgi:glycosyltransferase 2 family protein
MAPVSNGRDFTPHLALVYGPNARIVIGLLVSGVCLVLALRSVPLDELTQILEQANYAWLLVGLVVQCLIMAIRAARWQRLMDVPTRFSDVFWTQAIGFLGNNVLPLRAGEAARVMVLSRRGGVPWPRVAASVVVERALDVASILTLLVALLMVVPVPPLIAAGGMALAAALLSAGTVIVILLALGPRSERLTGWALSPLPKRFGQPIQRAVIDLLDGFRVVHGPGDALRMAAWSALAWGGSVIVFWLAIQAVTPGGAPVHALFATVALSIGVSLPSSPGFVGVFQYVGQQALVQPFPDQYSLAAALAITVLAHLIYYVPTTLTGAFAVIRLGVSVRGLQRPVPANRGSEGGSLG